MADEQPNTLSQGEQPVDASAPNERSASDVEGSSDKNPSWWQRITNRRPPSRENEENQATDGDAASGSGTSAELKLSQEELDRRIQSEADRREAARAKAQKEAERRELRDKDPWAYAEEERKEEQAAMSQSQLAELVTGIGSHHDKVSIDPIFLALPKAEQERIQKLEGAGRGLEGRKLVVTESLKALEKHWKAEGAKDAEAKLRRNSAFRKQVLSEMRGQTAEPELIAGGSPSEADKTVSSMLRDYYRLG